MTYAFLKAQGVDVGGCRSTDEEVAAATAAARRTSATKIVLPVDYLCCEVGRPDDRRRCAKAPIPAGFEGVDIGPKTIAAYTPTRSRTPAR